MLIIIFVVAAVLIAALLIYVSMRPDTFQVKRTALIAVAPQQAFSYINDFHHWAIWSPWEKLDPAMQRTFSGAAQGLGAIYEWNGNKKVGQGRMEITASEPASKVVIKLDFITPFKAQNVTEFTLVPSDTGVTVTWAMTGSLNFMMKLMHVLMNINKMVGRDFENGLNNMKTALEGSASAV